MNNTICYPIPTQKLQSEYFITEQGLTIDTAHHSSQEKKKIDCSLSEKKVIDEIEDLPDEMWRPIDEKGRYYVSSLGRVKSCQGTKAILLKPYENNHGYQRVDICLDGRHTFLVHRLVGFAFVENDEPQTKDTVDHIDGDKKNNKASNLRWLSRSDNVRAYYQRKREGVQDNAEST